ncbi:MAG: hypothetical protein ACYDCO_05590 [Armatimonadota bacterium]
MMNETIFIQAARIFDGWTDPDTGAGVLRIHPPGKAWQPARFCTPYQQSQPFREAGRKMMLHQALEGMPLLDSGKSLILLDLTTGAIEPLSEIGYDDNSPYTVRHEEEDGGRTTLVEIATSRVAAAVPNDGWSISGVALLADGRRAVVAHSVGKFYDEYCRTHFHLLTPDEKPTLFLELDGVYGNHLMPCPTNPDLFSYNAWPTPKRYIDGVLSMAKVDGSMSGYVSLDDNVPRAGDFWGVRDHYVWTPDGNRIVSYLNRQPVDPTIPFNHFHFDWWLSALDWRTGEDYCAQYPPHRWGGHMQMTPDSRWIVNGGGPGFDKLYAVNVAALKDGWNEQVICSYPTTNPEGGMARFYPYPFVLPDGSSVIFNAGWPGNEHGVYLAEWPKGL